MERRVRDMVEVFYDEVKSIWMIDLLRRHMIKHIVSFSCFYIFAIKITLHNLPQNFLTLLLVVFVLHLWNVDIISSIVSFDYHPLFIEVGCKVILAAEQNWLQNRQLQNVPIKKLWNMDMEWNEMKDECGMEWNVSMGWNEIWKKWSMEWKMNL